MTLLKFLVKTKVVSKIVRSRKSIPQAPKTIVTQPAYKESGGEKMEWQVGSKAIHKKWGEGMVVSVRGQGENTELDIAFPSPTGIKRLLAKFAPIEKG